MSFFSKLFKGDNAEGSAPAPPTPPPAPPPRTRSESPRKQAEAAQRERDEAAQRERVETAVNEDAPTIEMAAQRPPTEEAPPAKPANAAANPNATEELVLAPDVQAIAAPPPPPPPVAKGASAAKASSPMPAPPPPVGGARERETESSRGMPAARVKTGPAGTAAGAVGKPIGAPKGLTAANKALAAANAARKGTPSPLPPPPVAAGAAAPVRRSKADTIRGFAAPVLNAEGVFVPAPEHTLGQATAPEPAPALDHAQSIASAVATTPVELPAAPAAAAELDHAVDAAVDNLLDPQQAEKDAAALEAERAADRRAAAETFHSIVAANAAPVRELMFQLSVGRTPRKWAGSCRSVLAPLLSGARQIELDELSDAFAQLDSALELAAAETDAYIGPQTASAIQGAYTRLSGMLPQAFTALSERDGRRLMLLESLLLQVPAINRRVLGKLYGAGLSSLDRLSGAAADEISVVAGIDRKVAAALSAHLERFELERSQLDPIDARTQVHERLRGVLARLREQQEAFELAEQDEDLERKRESRRAREIATLELDVLLLEIGELSLTEELKRCAVRGKIQRLESYLEHAQASA